MRMRTTEELKNDLLGRDESGMGYQIASIGGSWYLVLNAQVALSIQLELKGERLDPSQLSIPLSEWLKEDDIKWLNDWAKLATPQKGEEELAKARQAALKGLGKLEGPVTCVQTHGSYISTTRPGEIFVRYSAYYPDFRINLSNGSVRSGTYATTATDRPHAPSGLAAVGRHALPNPAPASYTYTISPPPRTRISCGTVAPGFGQAGGGVEVQFKKALPAGAAHGPNLIPER